MMSDPATGNDLGSGVSAGSPHLPRRHPVKQYHVHHARRDAAARASTWASNKRRESRQRRRDSMQQQLGVSGQLPDSTQLMSILSKVDEAACSLLTKLKSEADAFFAEHPLTPLRIEKLAGHAGAGALYLAVPASSDSPAAPLAQPGTGRASVYAHLGDILESLFHALVVGSTFDMYKSSDNPELLLKDKLIQAFGHLITLLDLLRAKASQANIQAAAEIERLQYLALCCTAALAFAGEVAEACEAFASTAEDPQTVNFARGIFLQDCLSLRHVTMASLFLALVSSESPRTALQIASRAASQSEASEDLFNGWSEDSKAFMCRIGELVAWSLTQAQAENADLYFGASMSEGSIDALRHSLFALLASLNHMGDTEVCNAMLQLCGIKTWVVPLLEHGIALQRDESRNNPQAYARMATSEGLWTLARCLQAKGAETRIHNDVRDTFAEELWKSLWLFCDQVERGLHDDDVEGAPSLREASRPCSQQSDLSTGYPADEASSGDFRASLVMLMQELRNDDVAVETSLRSSGSDLLVPALSLMEALCRADLIHDPARDASLTTFSNIARLCVEERQGGRPSLIARLLMKSAHSGIRQLCFGILAQIAAAPAPMADLSMEYAPHCISAFIESPYFIKRDACLCLLRLACHHEKDYLTALMLLPVVKRKEGPRPPTPDPQNSPCRLCRNVYSLVDLLIAQLHAGQSDKPLVEMCIDFLEELIVRIPHMKTLLFKHGVIDVSAPMHSRYPEFMLPQAVESVQPLDDDIFHRTIHFVQRRVHPCDLTLHADFPPLPCRHYDEEPIDDVEEGL